MRREATDSRAAAASASVRGTVRLAAIEQRDRQVETREREVRRDLQRLAE